MKDNSGDQNRNYKIYSNDRAKHSTGFALFNIHRTGYNPGSDRVR